MKIDAWLKKTILLLSNAGITSAELDALVLLEDCLKLDRAFILAHPEKSLLNKQRLFLDKQVLRRSTHEPLAYIRQKVEFYARSFFVDKRVLVPRPETEAMIELLLQLPLAQQPGTVVADIGTGSGALAVTAKLELPQSTVVATDISSEALTVARKNNSVFKTTLMFCVGDLFKPLANQKVDILLANLPYVPTSFELNKSARFEPTSAIFGGNDGLDLYRKLFEQLTVSSESPQYILTESLPVHHKELVKIAGEYHYHLLKEHDFIQVFTTVAP